MLCPETLDECTFGEEPPMNQEDQNEDDDNSTSSSEKTSVASIAVYKGKEKKARMAPSKTIGMGEKGTFKCIHFSIMIII